MGFCQDIVISSVVDGDTRHEIETAALAIWSFLRMPIDHREFDDRVLLAPPETTDYLFSNEAAYELAVEQAGQFQAELPQFSTNFSVVIFAYIVAECFGGICLYSGFCCRDGQTVFAIAQAEKDGHDKLLKQIGIDSSGHFPPLARGYFGT